MRNPCAAALAGMVAAVATETVIRGVDMGYDHPGLIGSALFLGATFFGPGAFLLAVPLSHALRILADRGTGRGRLLALGVLCGSPLELLNHAIVGSLLHRMVPGRIPGSFGLSEAELRAVLILCTAGGAVLGLTCAWWISRPPRGES